MAHGYPSGVGKSPQFGIICSRRIQPISLEKKVTISSILLEVASKGCPCLQSPGGSVVTESASVEQFVPALKAVP